MSTVDEIEKAIAALSPRELDAFRLWFEAFEQQRFDAQIAADAEAGALDRFAQEALAEHRDGLTRRL